MALFMIGMVLVVTSGFSLYSHHCSHKEIANYSILVPVESCSCVDAVVSSCCELKETTTCNNSCEDDCCKDQQKFSKLDAEILFNVSLIEFHANVINLLLTEQNNDVGDISSARFNILWRLVSEPPPPLSNSDFRSLVQVYLN
ncbi:hypothetical protein [uncultured Carboxylicivirga sp.]|nr:hypothetical protein [uncultured Carboxylicivirga sp.]